MVWLIGVWLLGFSCFRVGVDVWLLLCCMDGWVMLGLIVSALGAECFGCVGLIWFALDWVLLSVMFMMD